MRHLGTIFVVLIIVVGRSYDESVLDVFPIYPTNDSWSQLNDREVICATYHIDLKKITGSMKGSGI